MLFNNKNKTLDVNEQLYRSHISHEMIFSTRLVSVLGIAMFLMFYLADKWAFSSNHDLLLYTRLGVTTLLGVIFLLTFKRTFFEKFSGLILPIPYLVATIAINYMIYLASPGDYAFQTYFAGLMLVIMTMFGWSFVSLTTTLFLSTFSLVLYSYIQFTSLTANTDESFAGLFINLAFLVTAALIGFISQHIRDRHLRENFFLQQSLQAAYKLKSEEARDNEYLANHDPLTDLPNRRHMTELLHLSLEEASLKNKVLVIMFVDLNGFKKVNDLYGHNAGDEVLVIVAKRLELAIRKGDHLSRLGGDEYLLGLMMDRENLDEVEAMANKLIHIISQSMNVEGLRIKIGASIGVAAYPIHANNIESLMAIADQRMYKAKRRKSHGDFFEDSTLNKKDESVVIFPGNAKSKNR